MTYHMIIRLDSTETSTFQYLGKSVAALSSSASWAVRFFCVFFLMSWTRGRMFVTYKDESSTNIWKTRSKIYSHCIRSQTLHQVRCSLVSDTRGEFGDIVYLLHEISHTLCDFFNWKRQRQLEWHEGNEMNSQEKIIFRSRYARSLSIIVVLTWLKWSKSRCDLSVLLKRDPTLHDQFHTRLTYVWVTLSGIRLT